MRYFPSLGYGILSGSMLLFPFFGGNIFEWVYFLTVVIFCVDVLYLYLGTFWY